MLKFFICILFFSISNAFGANIKIIKGYALDYTPEAILLSGVIEKGDFNKLVKLAAQLLKQNPQNHLIVYLDSVGGDVDEAIVIGKFLRRAVATVAVKGKHIYEPSSKNGKYILSNKGKQSYKVSDEILRNKNHSLKDEELTRCYSACILVLISGVRKFVNDNLDLRNENTSKWPADDTKKLPLLGLHRPYFEREHFKKLDTATAEKKYKELETTTRAYMYEMGASQTLVDRMLNTNSINIDLMLAEDFYKFIPGEAPFFEELKLAKCGSPEPQSFLTKNELSERKLLQDAFDKVKFDLHKKPSESMVTFKIGNSKTLGYYHNKMMEHYSKIDSCGYSIARQTQIATIMATKN